MSQMLGFFERGFAGDHGFFRPFARRDVAGETTMQFFALKPHIGSGDFNGELAAIFATMNAFAAEESGFAQTLPSLVENLGGEMRGYQR